MDRCVRWLRWLVPPLLGATLAALGWMAFRGNPSADAPPPAELPDGIAATVPGQLPEPVGLRRLAPRAGDVVLAEYQARGGAEAVGQPCVDQRIAPPALVRGAEPPAPVAAEEPGPRLLSPEREASVAGSKQAEPPDAAPAATAEPVPAAETEASVPPPAVAIYAPPAVPANRSAQLEQMARQADRHTRRGFALAERGAYFAARSQFIQALRLVAEGLDAELRTDKHSRALVAGLTAIRESDDFRTEAAWSPSGRSLAEIVARHETPLFGGGEPLPSTALDATKCYLSFAQEQLAASVAEEVAGSMALYALGKLHAVLAGKQSREFTAPGPKAVTFFQAALLVIPQNHLASNDLGVLFANGEHYQDAYRALVHSLSIQPQSTGWHNLAVVLRQLGRPEAAQRAEHLATAARQNALRKGGSSPGAVHMVDPQTFARTSTTPGGPGQVAPAPAPRQAAAQKLPGPTPASQSATEDVVARTVRPEVKNPTSNWILPWPPGKNRR